MTVEVATKISQLNVSLPGSGDSKSEGDDHIRLIKVAVLGTLTGCDTTGVVAFNVVTQATANSSTLAASTALVDAKITLAGFTASQIDVQTNAATSKATPVDADAIPIVDSATGFTLKKLTWGNLKTTLAAWINGGTLAGSFTALTVNSPVSLGYGTGAGGTVTQPITPTLVKTNTVTLHKPSGQITMNNEALAAGASVSFVCANNICSQNDGVIVNVVDDFGAFYTASILSVWSGYFSVRLTNVSAGTLSQAVRINFAIIKGAIA